MPGRRSRDIVGTAASTSSSTTPASLRSSRWATQITKPQGRVTLVGVPRKGNNISIYSLPLHFGKVLSGSHGGDAIPQQRHSRGTSSSSAPVASSCAS